MCGAGGEEGVGDVLVDAQHEQVGEVAALDRRCRGVVDHAELANVEHGDMLVEQQGRKCDQIAQAVVVRDDGEFAPAGHAVFLGRALSEVEDEARKLN